MTLKALYLAARTRFAEAGVPSPEGDAVALMGRFFGVDRGALILHGEETPQKDREEAFLAAVAERAARRPLQYILGEWDFMGLTLKVGEGVLIPREDTGVLVEAAIAAGKSRPAPLGLDLCAGTGAVALRVARGLPGARFFALELSETAFSYLLKNCAAYPALSVTPRRGDVLSPAAAADFPDGGFDLLLSNPPYIPTGELPGLQAEVRREPPLALDGGGDGLDFYRAIAKLWMPKLRLGGTVAVEIGETQGDAVTALFREVGVGDLHTLSDWAGLPRCVIGVRG